MNVFDPRPDAERNIENEGAVVVVCEFPPRDKLNEIERKGIHECPVPGDGGCTDQLPGPVNQQDHQRHHDHGWQPQHKFTGTENPEEKRDLPEKKWLLMQPDVVFQPIPEIVRQHGIGDQHRPEGVRHHIFCDQCMVLLIPHPQKGIERGNNQPQDQPGKKQEQQAVPLLPPQEQDDAHHSQCQGTDDPGKLRI